VDTLLVTLGGAVIATLVTVVGVLWRKGNDWEERWQKEVRRGVRLAVGASTNRIPAPDWKEDTAVMQRRAELEKTELDRVLADYLESTPPDRPGRISRPR
jgi:hypothetical protein